jgi:quinol-cytochrome oxidoreductase complex cytochrome b subunit
VLLLLATLALSFTGYLLPWDQLSLWAVTVGTDMARAAPLVGDEAHRLLVGGSNVGPATLLRFYVLHVALVPLAAAILMAIHFWRVRKDGGISGPL